MSGFGQTGDAFSALHKLLWKSIEARPDRFGNRTIMEPDYVPVEEGYSDAKPGADFPVLKHLDQVLTIARAHEFKAIIDAFAAVSGEIMWSQNPRYTAEKGGLNLLNGYAYASLSGPESPIQCLSPRGGFLMMGPDVIYPSHNHAPREIYLVMTPGLEWRLDEGEWFDVHPGDLIFHAPWQMHAMRSGNQPVLAYAAWLEPGSREEIGWTDNPEKA